MKIKKLVKEWFQKWENGDFEEIPVDDSFTHSSPFGTINGKENYLSMVRKNTDSFLGHQFEIIDEIYEDQTACVRYITRKEDWSMDVSEWFYLGNDKIGKIVSYYNVGEVSYEENMENP